jgi:hypothetical protein
MKNLHDVLRQKENSVKRLEQEIEAIRTVLAMLEEEPEQPANGNLRPPLAAPVSLASAPSIAGMYSAASQNTRPEPQKVKSDPQNPWNLLQLQDEMNGRKA